MFIIDYLIVIYLSGLLALIFNLVRAYIQSKAEPSFIMLVQVLIWPYYTLSKEGRRGLWKIIVA